MVQKSQKPMGKLTQCIHSTRLRIQAAALWAFPMSSRAFLGLGFDRPHPGFGYIITFGKPGGPSDSWRGPTGDDEIRERRVSGITSPSPMELQIKTTPIRMQ
uniref:Uncharacterized protein n=1 Tax=Ditylum brightwellii TaxID=49249 RepID=A0A7S1YM41_9STRA